MTSRDQWQQIAIVNKQEEREREKLKKIIEKRSRALEKKYILKRRKIFAKK